MNAELAGKVVSAMLTLFITSKEDDGKAGMEDAVNEDEKVTNDELKFELGSGAIISLPPGKDITTVDPKRSDTQFESYVNTCITVIASSMGIPKEVLVKKYESQSDADQINVSETSRMMMYYVSNDFQHRRAADVDKPMTKNDIASIAAQEQTRLDALIKRGALVYGEVELDMKLDDMSDLISGDYRFAFSLTTTPLAKSMTAVINWTADGLTTYFEDYTE